VCHFCCQIDWHDFVVVETIDFYEDEDEELPPPMSLKELMAFNKQQAMGAGAAAADDEAAAADVDMDVAEQVRPQQQEQQRQRQQ
jgi:splicing factor 3A subunit 1